MQKPIQNSSRPIYAQSQNQNFTAPLCPALPQISGAPMTYAQPSSGHYQQANSPPPLRPILNGHGHVQSSVMNNQAHQSVVNNQFAGVSSPLIYAQPPPAYSQLPLNSPRSHQDNFNPCMDQTMMIDNRNVCAMCRNQNCGTRDSCNQDKSTGLLSGIGLKLGLGLGLNLASNKHGKPLCGDVNIAVQHHDVTCDVTVRRSQDRQFLPSWIRWGNSSKPPTMV